MTNPNRGKDLIDVQELIAALKLPREFGEKLNPFVQSKYEDVWNLNRAGRRRFMRIWNHDLPAHPKSLDELVDSLRSIGQSSDADVLAAMRQDGITLDTENAAPTGLARLFTDNPDVAAKYDMHEESEFLEP
jgi:hypothetical protein